MIDVSNATPYTSAITKLLAGADTICKLWNIFPEDETRGHRRYEAQIPTTIQPDDQHATRISGRHRRQPHPRKRHQDRDEPHRPNNLHNQHPKRPDYGYRTDEGRIYKYPY